MRTARVLVALMASFAFTGCTTGPSEFSDPADTINVKPGEEFVIVLESNASTGFRWTLSATLDESVVDLLMASYRPGTGGNAVVGSGGHEYWRFAAVGRGTTLIPMAYVGPGGGTPARTVLFTVTVS
jgi:inhibitor of cysteine peptidase